MMENFADTTPPANPLRGQLWFDTNANTLYVCPADGTSNANAWLALTSTASGGTTTFGAVTVTGNLQANNITAISTITGANGVFTNISVSANANIATGNITTGNISTLNTTVISAGSNTTAGTLTGTWTANGGSSGNSLIVTNGNIVASTGIKTDNYYYANGTPISFAGTYNNSNVAAYLPTYGGNILTVQTQATTITTGANTTAGTLTGNWTLSTGSRLQSTYADLAERFEADTYYDAGTVVELGGDKEITAVQYELSDDVFGVVSATAGYIMNGAAGTDETHPPIAVGGRVQVKIIGKIRKGQRLVSAGKGVARAALPGEATAFNIIGRALENKTTDELGAIEAFVKIN
jgi:hypothetical protein